MTRMMERQNDLRRSVPPPPAPRSFKQARAEKTHGAILAAAASLYAERGFHSVQTPDIAKRAKISVGALYRYFKNKHEIFAELVHRILEQNRMAQDELAGELVRRYEKGEAKTEDIADYLIDWTWEALSAAPPDLLRTLEAMRFEDRAFSELYDQYDRYERQVFARALAKVTSRATIPSPLAAARVLDLIVPAVAIWARLHPEEARGVKEATRAMVTRYLTWPK